MRLVSRVLGVPVLVLSMWMWFVPAAQAASTTRVSKATDGTQANGPSGDPSISADGRFVAFQSLASNLVSNDTNDSFDVFVRDRQTGQTTRVSKATDGSQGNEGSGEPSISADGRFVAFRSDASNLVAGDTNNQADVFVRDRQTGQTTRVSKATDGTEGSGFSLSPSISADGRFVAFPSDAENLVAGDTNSERDIFVRDRQTGQTTRVSKATDGSQTTGFSDAPSISADGRFVAFASDAANLVNGDTNNQGDVFVRDRQTGQTTRVSKATSGTQGDDDSFRPSISADGRFVAFESDATNLVAGDSNSIRDVFVRDRETGQTTRVSKATNGTQGNNFSSEASVSADGHFVAFSSYADNLVGSDTNVIVDIFLRDRTTGTTVRVSVASDGSQGVGPGPGGADGAFFPSISADGHLIAFTANMTNLVPGDTNGTNDIFVRDTQ